MPILLEPSCQQLRYHWAHATPPDHGVVSLGKLHDFGAETKGVLGFLGGLSLLSALLQLYLLQVIT
jgi:hypothetical protein